MNSTEKLDQTRRSSRFETLEERLALSAQSLLAIASAAQSSESKHVEIAPAVLPIQSELVRDQLESALLQQGVLPIAHASQADQLTGLDQARAMYGLAGKGQTVAIIDTGIAYDHRALGGGYGRPYRVVGGWDFAENDANPYDDAPAGFHGTHVAGIVGSTDATYRGVAPGTDLVALRVFDDQGNGSFTWVEQALQWVHQHRNDYANPITVVNLSLGAAWNGNAPPGWAMLEDEFSRLKADGIFVSVSAGNSFTSYNAAGLAYPAASSYVVPVASVDANGMLSNFSQRNSRVIAAPGRSIVSTVPDYATGADGVANDFGAASGTSMAAPYVAGAAALVREAMQFVGLSNINQDAIYNQFKKTADVISDSVTKAQYSRLNLQKAIQSLMPVDDYGSTLATARSLGTLATNSTFAGVIGTLNDVDYFQFTASSSGRMSFTFDVTHNLKVMAQLTGGNATLDRNVLSFDATAGKSYSVAVSTTDGIGKYQVKASVVPVTTVLGTVDLNQLTDKKVAGDAWFQVTAMRTGTLTAEARFTHSAGNVDLQVYSGQQQLLASSQSSANSERLDVNVTAGQTYLVRLVGNNQDVDVTLANLISAQGTTVNVFGTSGADKYTLSGGSQVAISVNGIAYQFKTTAAANINFQGGDGDDTIVVSGNTANLKIKLNDVRSTNSNSSSGSSGSSTSGSSSTSNTLLQKAYELDEKYGFKSTSNYQTNLRKQNEKWIQDKSNGWWFITKDGKLHQWNGSSNILTSKVVATLDASFYTTPGKLHDAKKPVSSQGMLSELAAPGGLSETSHSAWETAMDSEFAGQDQFQFQKSVTTWPGFVGIMPDGAFRGAGVRPECQSNAPIASFWESVHTTIGSNSTATSADGSFSFLAGAGLLADSSHVNEGLALRERARLFAEEPASRSDGSSVIVALSHRQRAMFGTDSSHDEFDALDQFFDELHHAIDETLAQ